MPKPYVCQFCGRPTDIPPEDQVVPPDVCHDEDHEDDGRVIGECVEEVYKPEFYD
jgi:hypothetical protein